ncbi:hypothetical protein MKW92_009743 [Papaver armeniacum]|nr:hypothetical protein MKW92_009743 [Papaver armeniacum]
MTSNVGVTSFLLVFVTSFALLHHTLGWTVPDNGDAYPNWAANKKFKVSDTLGKPLNFRPRILEMVFSSLLCESELLFRFLLYKIVLTQQTVFIQKKQQEHELYIVSKEEFDNCTTTNQTSIIRQGPANINLTSICPHYFICTIGKHCQFGQKLTINVTDDSATKTPSGLPPTTRHCAYAYYSRQLCFTHLYRKFRWFCCSFPLFSCIRM